MQVKVRAVIWHGDRIVVARESRQTQPYLSLPGGRPKPGEGLLDALGREVIEETGVRIHVGRLLYVAESVSGHAIQDVNLIFAASAVDPIDEEAVCLVDPREPHEPRVLPPILEAIAEDGAGPPCPRWLGNVWIGTAATA